MKQETMIRCGLVGCGSISKNHLFAIKKNLSTIKLVAVCDKNAELVKEVAREFKVSSYDDYTSMLDKEDLELVILCTPSGFHPAQTIEASQKGINVLTEKPMALILEDANKMVNACEENNINLFVVKQIRFNPLLKALKSSIEEGYFGKIFLFHANVFWTRPQSYYDESDWRGSKDLDGGSFMNQASHHVDLLSWLFGRPEELHAYTGTLGRSIESEDTGVVNFKFQQDILGSMSVTTLTYPSNLETSLTVIGEKGTVKIGGQSLDVIEKWEFENKKANSSIDSSNKKFFDSKSYGHEMYYEAVAKSLRGKTNNAVSGLEAIKSLEIITAIQESSLEKRTIKFPLNI